MVDSGTREWFGGGMSKYYHKKKGGLMMIAFATLSSYWLFNDLHKGEVTVHHNGLMANPEQNPFEYYLNIGFFLVSSITLYIVGFVLLFSKSTSAKDSNEDQDKMKVDEEIKKQSG